MTRRPLDTSKRQLIFNYQKGILNDPKRKTKITLAPTPTAKALDEKYKEEKK